MTLALLLAKFALCAAVIGAAGFVLTRSALLADAAQVHAGTAVAASVMSGLVISD